MKSPFKEYNLHLSRMLLNSVLHVIYNDVRSKLAEYNFVRSGPSNRRKMDTWSRDPLFQPLIQLKDVESP